MGRNVGNTEDFGREKRKEQIIRSISKTITSLRLKEIKMENACLFSQFSEHVRATNLGGSIFMQILEKCISSKAGFGLFQEEAYVTTKIWIPEKFVNSKTEDIALYLLSR
jgi:hypothetical protein